MAALVGHGGEGITASYRPLGATETPVNPPPRLPSPEHTFDRLRIALRGFSLISPLRAKGALQPVPLRDHLPDPRRPALADIRKRNVFLKSSESTQHTTLTVGK